MSNLWFSLLQYCCLPIVNDTHMEARLHARPAAVCLVNQDDYHQLSLRESYI